MSDPGPETGQTGGPSVRDRLAAFDHRFGPVFAMLGLVFLIIVVIDVSDLPLTPAEQDWIRFTEFAIYGVFIFEFGCRLVLSPAKVAFLRHNWVAILALALPLLRPLIVLRALPIAASGQGLAALAISHRGFAALRQITRGRQLVYVVSLTVTIVLLAAGAAFYLERYEPRSPIHSFGESLWWASTLVTTINSADDPVSGPGRIVALLLRVYAVSVFGYITAFIATWLIGDRGTAVAEGQGAATRAANRESSTLSPDE